METKDYLAEKAVKKKTALKAVWILLVFAVLIISMVVKITITGSSKTASLGGLPGSNDAYTIAKGFIEPTLKSLSNEFHDDKYQFAKLSDSVYVIKSAVESKDRNGEQVTTEFKITLQYKGGRVSKQKNWNVLALQQY